MVDRNTHAAPVFKPDPMAECASCARTDALYADQRGTFCGRCGPSAHMRVSWGPDRGQGIDMIQKERSK